MNLHFAHLLINVLTHALEMWCVSALKNKCFDSSTINYALVLYCIVLENCVEKEMWLFDCYHVLPFQALYDFFCKWRYLLTPNTCSANCSQTASVSGVVIIDSLYELISALSAVSLLTSPPPMDTWRPKSARCFMSKLKLRNSYCYPTTDICPCSV